jgi:hypothetical protein
MRDIEPAPLEEIKPQSILENNDEPEPLEPINIS